MRGAGFDGQHVGVPGQKPAVRDAVRPENPQMAQRLVKVVRVVLGFVQAQQAFLQVKPRRFSCHSRRRRDDDPPQHVQLKPLCPRALFAGRVQKRRERAVLQGGSVQHGGC